MFVQYFPNFYSICVVHIKIDKVLLLKWNMQSHKVLDMSCFSQVKHVLRPGHQWYILTCPCVVGAQGMMEVQVDYKNLKNVFKTNFSQGNKTISECVHSGILSVTVHFDWCVSCGALGKTTLLPIHRSLVRIPALSQKNPILQWDEKQGQQLDCCYCCYNCYINY